MSKYYKNKFGVGAFIINESDLGNYTKSDFMVCDKCGADLYDREDIIFIPLLNKAYCPACGHKKFHNLRIDPSEREIVEEREVFLKRLFGIRDDV